MNATKYNNNHFYIQLNFNTVHLSSNNKQLSSNYLTYHILMTYQHNPFCYVGWPKW